MNPITVFVCLVLATLVVLAARHVFRQRKKGFCGRADCSACSGCHKKEVSR